MRTLTALTRTVALLAFVVGMPRVRGEIRLLTITTTAGFATGLPGPGSPATIFVTGLQIANNAAPIAVTYGDGFAAPIYAAVDLGAYQIVNFQVPWEFHLGPITLSQGSNSTILAAPTASWGEFFTVGDGTAVALHVANYSLVTVHSPATAGEWLVVYASNLGVVIGPPATGKPAPIDALIPLDPSVPTNVLNAQWTFTAWLMDPTGDRLLTTNFFGLAPGLVGVYQVNVKMPDTLPGGALQIYLQRSRDCGFFFTQGCGRGIVKDISQTATIP